MMVEATQPDGRESFAALLRRHRVAAALSQGALAERAGISVRAVSDLERGVKTRPYLETVRRIADALGLAPDQRSTLAAAARPPELSLRVNSFAGNRVVARLGRPVPPTPLIGRERETAKLVRLMREPGARLATLTGPGGVGKTRLAMAVADRLTDAFPDGVAWVELGPLADPALVPNAAARALALGEAPESSLVEDLRAFLRDKRLLMVLDNCEHLRRAAGALAADVLEACPGLVVLATSRAPLRIGIEQVFRLEPLGLPDSGAAAVAEAEAVQLFVQQARAVRPEFVLTVHNAADVAEICRRLDGLPLAIELAAARTRVLSPEALRPLLVDRLRVLVGGPEDAPARQRTLWAAIAWSHDLLSPSGQALFRRLAVFVGTFGLEAAAAVATGSDPFAALDGLEVLVDESLVRRVDSPEGEARFITLETVREFMTERLRTSSEAGEIHRAHAAYHLAVAEEASSALSGPTQVQWLVRLEAEHDNLRAALAWAVAHDRELAARIAVALRSFWEARGHWTDAATWFDRCLAAGEAVSPAVRIRVLCGASSFARLRNNYERATFLAEEGLALARVPGIPVEVRALAQNNLGNLALELGQYTRARACYLQSKELYESINNNKGIGDELNNLGVLEQIQGRFDAARALFGRSLAIRGQIGDTIALPVTLTNLGANACFEKDYERSAACHAEALSIRREIGDRRGVALSLSNLGIVAYLRGDLAAAEQWYAEGMFFARDVDDQLATAKILLGQGRIAVRRGKLTEGMHLLTQALMILRQMGSRRRMADVIEAFAAAAATNGRYVPAAQLFGAAEAARASYGSSFRSMESQSRDSDLAELQDRMGEPAFRAAWEEGLALPLEEAMELAQTTPAGQSGASAPL